MYKRHYHRLWYAAQGYLLTENHLRGGQGYNRKGAAAAGEKGGGDL